MFLRIGIIFSLIIHVVLLEAQSDHYVLLISFDGFRYDYVEKYNPPNFQKFIAGGTAADGLIVSFPSKTFPNHYTTVSGLYPGHHGLVDNGFYDPARDDTFSMGKRYLVEDAYYYGGLPLWQLVQYYGMKSASYFWVGSEAPVAGRYPDYFYRYDGSVANEERIRQVMEWLNLPEGERPNFITLYFSLVDSQGHRTGPESNALRDTVMAADRLLGMVMEQLREIDLPVDVIVTSDHGMYEIAGEPSHQIWLPGILQEIDTNFVMVNSGTNCHMYIEDLALRKVVYGRLRASGSHYQVYYKEETPEKWHYRDHPRIGDIIVSADPGYLLMTEPRRYPLGMTPNFGVHGYDPYTTPEMKGIFYARGPQIKEGLKINAFENVHVYPLVARLLGIHATTIDSDIRVLEPIIR